MAAAWRSHRATCCRCGWVAWVGALVCGWPLHWLVSASRQHAPAYLARVSWPPLLHVPLSSPPIVCLLGGGLAPEQAARHCRGGLQPRPVPGGMLRTRVGTGVLVLRFVAQHNNGAFKCIDCLAVSLNVQVIPSSWLRLFSPREVNQLLGGGEAAALNIDDMQAHTVYRYVCFCAVCTGLDMAANLLDSLAWYRHVQVLALAHSRAACWLTFSPRPCSSPSAMATRQAVAL